MSGQIHGVWGSGEVKNLGRESSISKVTGCGHLVIDVAIVTVFMY